MLGGDSNKMNKIHERLITAAGIAVLVAIFFYQVAYGISGTIGPNGTMTVTNGNISGTLTLPPGSKVNNFTIVPEENTSYAYPPQTITYSWEPGNNPDCSNCYFQTFTMHDGPYVYQGYRYSGDSEAHPEYLNLCATRTIYEKAALANFQHPVKDCVSLPPSFEPSYKWGYLYGFNSHKCTIADSKGSVCDITSHALSLICANYGNITSSTGCKNGYLDGSAAWLHCRAFPKDCHKLPQSS
jgi:hypothetical protein